MWSALSLEWRTCFELGWTSFRRGSAPIGAAVFDADGQLIASGRNQINDPQHHSGSLIASHPLAHAELNALLALDFDSIDKYTCALYSTLEPCPLCIGAVCMAGIKRIHYAARDPWAGAVNLLEASPYMRWKQIRAQGPASGVLQEVVICLAISAHQQVQGMQPRGDFVGAYERIAPMAVGTAMRLDREGVIEDLRRSGVSAQEAFDGIASHLIAP